MGLNEIVVQGVGRGGNFLTAVQRIKEELHRAKQEEEDAIKRSVITAIKHYKWTRFHFNEVSSSMLTEPGVFEYGPEDPPGSGNGYPAHMLEIDQIQVFRDPVAQDAPQQNTPSATRNDAYPMRREHFDQMRYWIESSSTGNRPHWYSWYADRFFVFPASAGGQHRLLFDYLADLDHPRAQFVDGEWAYFDSFGDPIEDDYSTPWLDHAEELIRNRAKADLWASVFYSTEKAQVSRGQEMDALRVLGVARHKRLATGYVRPHFSGDWSGEGGYPY